MYVETSALQNAILAASKDKFEVRDAKMPAFAGKPVVPTNSGSALFIFSTDPAKQRAAWEFVKFVTSERGYTIITSKIGYLPLRPAIVDDPQYLQGWVKDHPLVQPNLEQLKNLQPWVSFPGPNYRQVVKTMMDAVQQAIYGTDDAQKILSDAQTQAQAFMPNN
jgi:multiple sugar transport system substrate-binding protein